MYVISAVTAQYFNFLVLIVQFFLKVPALKALAPTQTEPVFSVTQILALTTFLVVGLVAVVRFRDRGESGALTKHHAESTQLPQRLFVSH